MDSYIGLVVTCETYPEELPICPRLPKRRDLESLPRIIGGCRGKTARLVKATDRNTGRQSLGLAVGQHILKIRKIWSLVHCKDAVRI